MMRFACLLLGVGLMATAASAQQIKDGQLELLDSALAQVEMTLNDVAFDRGEMATFGGDRWVGRYFTLLHSEPFKLPLHGQLNLEMLSDTSSGATSLLARACRFADHPIRRGLIGDALEPYLKPPDTLPAPSITTSKNILVGPEYAALRKRVDLIYAMADDKEFAFGRAVDEVDKGKYRERLFDFFVRDDNKYHDLVYEILAKIDLDRLLAGAQDFSEAALRIADTAGNLVIPEARRELKTDRGLIVIGSSGDDKYEYFVPPLLIFDGGGNDQYLFSGYPEPYPLAMIIDLKGNDRYISTDSTRPGIGGAILGMAVVVDREGDDLYQGVNVTQGAALFGVGALYDRSGKDTYVAREYSQGAAGFGIGLLADNAGHDSLYCVDKSQGFGYSQGCGLLVNLAGDDRYMAEDDTVINPSPQTAEHNSSLAQGVGFGERADYLDGHSWAGGVGILCDVSGNDRYSAGLFAQGCAYWYAVGMLLDGAGNDSYEGIWYVQGSGAHFGVGYLDDFAGDDLYVATHNMAIGAGHDFTVGYLNERGGNDSYTVPNLSLGGGNANGIGIFHDHAGDDAYHTKGGITLGRAAGLTQGIRRYLHTFGVFVDGGGEDSYNEPYAGNGLRWIGPKSDTTAAGECEIGVGVDR